MATKTIPKKATKTARNATKTAKAQTTQPATKNAARTKRGAKDSTPDTKRLSQIEAAMIVLRQSSDAMNCKAMVEAMRIAGLWASPNGATPEATLYASILREINAKGKDARFKKVDRGRFSLAERK